MIKKVSKQQKGGLATAKAADVAARNLYRPMRRAFWKAAGSYSAAADLLNLWNIPPPRGGRWFPASVQRTIKRIERLRGKPLVHPDLIEGQIEALIEAADAEDFPAVRYSEDGRRLRSEKQLAADRKARRKKNRVVRKEWRVQHGGRLRERLLALYQTANPRSAKTVAKLLNQENFPTPPGCRRWHWAAVLDEGDKAGAPWPRKFTPTQLQEHFSARRFKQAHTQASELERQGRHAEAEKVWLEYFERERAYEPGGERKPFRGIRG